MNTNCKLGGVIGKVRHLELPGKIDKKEKQLNYCVREGKIHYQDEIVREHRLLTKKLSHHWRDAKWSSYITTPVIVSCIMPVGLMDFWATAYQFLCFPASGILKVQRHNYIAYCGYVNGVIAYVQEIAARTEQYWCPIKHAFRLKTRHSRYRHFLDFGDADQYREQVEEVRRDFNDLKKPT
jgi:hypothetical protein